LSLKAIHNVDHTILLCRNLAKTKAFCRDVMGVAVESDGERWVEFRISGAILVLRSRGLALWGTDGPLEKGSAAVQLAFRVPPSAFDGCHA
jgi:catechol 2,3-dioxygenase-like lactoylglutathione lyase family enzyme